MALNFHHLGIVVRDIESAGKLYGDMLGLKLWKHGISEDKNNGVLLLSLLVGNTFIELLQPTRPDNRYAKHLGEKGEGLFHLCFNSDDFDNEVNAWKEKGYIVEEEMAGAFEGPPFRLAWISPESTTGVWIELADNAGRSDHT